MTIVPLTALSRERYNAFLLQGLQEHPEAFRISPGDARRKPFLIAEASDEEFTLAALSDDGALLGVVTFIREQPERMRHKGWLVRMYVASSAAGQGIGRALVRHAVARAGKIHGLDQINLTVVASNERARRLYRTEGFVVFAREARALKDGAIYQDEEQMAFTFAA